MGAALQLARAQQLPPAPKRKRGGGGSGDGYDEFVARVWQDKRMTPKTRELLLLIAWLRHRDPQRDSERGKVWARANEILGVDGRARGLQRPRLARLVDGDRPRYDTDMHSEEWQNSSCQSPMIRREGMCGQPSSNHAPRVDAATGWHYPVWYCARHRDFGRAAEAAYRAGHRPDPIPNRGGMLPSYLNATGGDEQWIRLYEWASKWCYSSWKPPQGYGLRADDWPAPGLEPPVRPVRLKLAAVDGELVGSA